MFAIRLALAWVLSLICVCAIGAESQVNSRPQPPNVIFDTDIWSDIDDTLALAMLHALHDRHELNLVAVTISTDDPWCAPYVDLVNTFYGHSQIPIGVVHDGPTAASLKQKLPEGIWPVKGYTELLSNRKKKDGSYLYPHRLTDGSKAPEAVALLRKVLAAQPDNSVVVIQVGYSTNLARLLDTPPDQISLLSGRDLIAKKVRFLSIMAGNFHETQIHGKVLPRGAPELNLLADVPPAQKLYSQWPTAIVDSGFEIGLGMLYPGVSIAHDFSYAPHHPIVDTYLTFCEEMRARYPNTMTCPHDHATFDLTSVLYAIRPDRNYFSLSKPGKITVLADGGSRFDEAADGAHRYLILSEEQKARALEALVMLASQPPVALGASRH